jgi:cytochrome c biogenesis protein CcmG, thiol:disulfide interchange protein DsbE
MKMAHVVLALLLMAQSPAAIAKQPVAGEAAPGFTLTLLDQKQVSFADLKGKVVLINYMATWCAGCIAEMPVLSKYYKRNQARGLAVYAVLIQDNPSQPKTARAIAGLSYPTATSMTGRFRPVKGRVPSSYIIDRKGVVRFAIPGEVSAGELAKMVDPLLAE